MNNTERETPYSSRNGITEISAHKIDIYEAKKCFPDSRKACLLKRKVAKMRFFGFSLQYTGLP
jgi:hypothetical protein